MQEDHAMQAVMRLGRGFVTLIALAAVGAILIFAIADPGALVVAVPLALAFGMLLAGRRLQSLRLIVAADALAVVAVCVLALIHLRS
jgi:hypothetical protein